MQVTCERVSVPTRLCHSPGSVPTYICLIGAFGHPETPQQMALHIIASHQFFYFSVVLVVEMALVVEVIEVVEVV